MLREKKSVLKSVVMFKGTDGACKFTDTPNENSITWKTGPILKNWENFITSQFSFVVNNISKKLQSGLLS